MRVALPLLLAAAACAGPDPAPPKDPGPIGMNLPDDEVVAILNGKPILRREVTDRAMDLEGRRLIESYVRWRIRNDRIRALGIDVTAEDLTARAKAYPANARRDGNEENIKQELAKLRMETEDDYVRWLVSERHFPERVAVERALVYDLLTEGCVEFDAVAFVDERHATAFQSKLKNGADLNGLVKDLRAANVQVGRWPRMCASRTVAVPVLVNDEWLLKHLLELQDGAISDVERTSSGYLLVFRCLKVHPPGKGSYAERRAEVEALTLRALVQDPQLEAWHSKLSKGMQVSIMDKYQPKEK
jgi:hypothetical protein